MNVNQIKAAIALGLMVATFSGAFAIKPTRKFADTRPAVNLETLFPSAFADWKIDDRMPPQIVAPDTAALLSKLYSQTLSRTYYNSQGERIMLSVAYGGDQSEATRAHRPEVCYPSAGFQVISTEDVSLTIAGQPLPVRQLVMRLGARIEPVSYWIVVGEKIALSGGDQKMAQLSYSLRGYIVDGMLVRVSNIDPDLRRSFNLQQRFLADMSGAFAPELRPRVIGGSAGV